MKLDELEKMAQQTAAYGVHPSGEFIYSFYTEQLQAFARLIAEHEPVALEAVYETIIHWDEGGGKRSRRELARRIVSLYTTPPQRTWVGLTDIDYAGLPLEQVGLVRWAEAKLKEKNT